MKQGTTHVARALEQGTSNETGAVRPRSVAVAQICGCDQVDAENNSEENVGA